MIKTSFNSRADYIGACTVVIFGKNIYRLAKVGPSAEEDVLFVIALCHKFGLMSSSL